MLNFCRIYVDFDIQDIKSFITYILLLLFKMPIKKLKNDSLGIIFFIFIYLFLINGVASPDRLF